ncbi:MAG TPA: leucine--tRNA ligase [Patescibacteria group bacterium]|nr:leucine--tRNA ligase [Patescibacteria group bacterium]
MEKYNHKTIEKKWQKVWEEQKLYQTPEGVTRENKFYILPQLPYPSGEGLHVGHAEVYTACDIYARFQRMNGKKVLQVIGWDAFGLPAENFAIKNNVHPRVNTNKAIDNFRKQIKSLGISVDWSREVGSHNPDYYKWTQWFFLLMYERGLAYRKKQKVNWCPSCKTVLANEQVVDGTCERCATEVEQREMEQWYLKITDYADRLYDDLDKIDWPKETIRRQKEWIGKKKGAEVTFKLSVPGQKEGKHGVRVFTTRLDTIFGVTFVTVSPEVAKKWLDVGWQAPDEVKKYVEDSLSRTDKERMEGAGEKTGVFTEVYAINPVNGGKVPVYVADYVLGDVGTGAVMGVPAHDERDYEFAKKFKLPIKKVVAPLLGAEETAGTSPATTEEAFTEDGVLINSEEYNGLSSEEARKKILDDAQKDKWTQEKTTYHLHDWSVSRQRFWGAPIPIIKKELTASENKLCQKYQEKPDHVLNLHAWWSDPKEHFHAWLDDQLIKKGIKSETPELPDALTPKSDTWLHEALKHLENESINTVLTARSLSSWTALRVAEQKKLRKVILIAPSLPTEEWKERIRLLDTVESDPKKALLSFIEDTIDFKKVRENVREFTVFLSTNDPYIPLEPAENFIRNNISQARIIRVRDAGHFDGKSGYYMFEQLLEEIIRPVRVDLKSIDPEDLPVILPDDVDFKPTGQSPLTYSDLFQKGVEEKYGKGWKREVDTLDTFMCSSWYYYRYLDPHNDQAFASEDALKKWMPVDFYLGGVEHVNGHLLYARFFTKVLFDAGYIDFEEPFSIHRHQGTIAGQDGRRMSKRWGNVINPTDVVEQYGADTARVYEMFMGPLEQDKAWNDHAVQGVRRFLVRIWNLMQDDKKSHAKSSSLALQRLLHKTIQIITNDTKLLKFNTAVARFMEFTNLWMKDGECLSKADTITLLTLLAPYAPHMAEELAYGLRLTADGKYHSIHLQKWPKHDESLVQEDTVTIIVQVNGKMRSTLHVDRQTANSKQQTAEKAKKDEKVKKYLEGKTIKKEIFVPGKLVNFVV